MQNSSKNQEYVAITDTHAGSRGDAVVEVLEPDVSEVALRAGTCIRTRSGEQSRRSAGRAFR